MRISESDLEFMQHVAKQVAVAVDNVLHDKSAQAAQEQLDRERDRLHLLLEVNNAVVSHLGMDEMFTAISASLARSFSTTAAACCSYDPVTRAVPMSRAAGPTAASSPRNGRATRINLSGRQRADDERAGGAR